MYTLPNLISWFCLPAPACIWIAKSYAICLRFIGALDEDVLSYELMALVLRPPGSIGLRNLANR